jgi:hypothetical protein
MGFSSDGSIRSRGEMEEVLRKYERNKLFFGLVGAGWLVGGLIVEALCRVFLHKSPINWLNSNGHIWGFVVVFVLAAIGIEQTRIFKREVSDLKLPLRAALQFQKGESEIDNGIANKNAKLVSQGIERLEGFEPCFTEMPDYQELLAKGRAWLSEHQGK